MAFGIAVSCKAMLQLVIALRQIEVHEFATGRELQEWLAMASELPWHAVAQPTAISVFLPEKANGVPARSMSPVPLASVRLPKGRGAFRQLTFGFSGRGRVSTAADAAAGVDTLLDR
uniref:Uncharacterized protein n=2 Tax=Oryza glumipatula TaxID=40148 RepID=A0A0D9YWX1_9ORYZ